MKTFMTAFLILVCATLVVQAATPAERPPFKGFYVGVDIGRGEYTPDWKTTETYNPDGTSPVTPESSHSGNVSDPNASMKGTETFPSLYLGYNFQLAPKWLLGVEGRWGTVDLTSTLNYIPGLDPTADDGTGEIPAKTAVTHGTYSTATVEIKWSRALAARAGYLVAPKSLLYVSIGYAQISVSAHGTCPADTYVCDPAAGTQTYGITDETASGITYGIGFEQAITPHWIARLAYSKADYDSVSFTAMQWSDTAFGAVAKLEPSSSTINLGIAYKF